ncbi:hypothetical protein EDC04DRAFT_2773244 [Pisolithus marmoratus]|nr:hypothetical protein EDC04DRAFT_2773244 [Pisolithus marmoratus]
MMRTQLRPRMKAPRGLLPLMATGIVFLCDFLGPCVLYTQNLFQILVHGVPVGESDPPTYPSDALFRFEPVA